MPRRSMIAWIAVIWWFGGPSEASAEEGDPPQSPLSSIEAIPPARLQGVLEDEIALTDVSVDQAWATEALSERVASRLKDLDVFLEGKGPWDEVSPWVSASFRTSSLHPALTEPVHRDGPLRVYRLRPAEPLPLAEATGPEALRASLAGFSSVFGEGAIECHFKIVAIKEGPAERFQTKLHVELVAGPGAAARREITADWIAGWRREGEAGVLETLKLSSFDEVICEMPGGSPWFRDETVAVLGGNESYRAQLVPGLDYWRGRMDHRVGLEVTGPHGLAIGDVNGDGLDDVYVCEPGGLPNRLYIQQPDATAKDVSHSAGVDFIEPTHSALLVDLDNDGDQDLVAAVGRYLYFYANDGKARFEQRAVAQSRSMIRSMAAIDVDDNRYLDIYACGYFARQGDSVGLGRPMPYHDANNGTPNHLLVNRGGWEFVNVTEEWGLDVNNRRFSYACAWEDYDNDGDPDLYVANDFGGNCLYRNDGGRFTEVAAEAGVEDISAGMSVCWGDYNQDGFMDLYIGNMFSSAGNRIAYQRHFREDNQAAYQRHARGNTLFENNGDGHFRDVTMEAGVNLGRWAWSSPFVDLNNDGLEDLVVANGMVTAPDDTGDL